jgi:entericidin A
MSMQRKLIAVILASLFSALLAGCNTVQGFGKDVQKAGEVLEDSAKKK